MAGNFTSWLEKIPLWQPPLATDFAPSPSASLRLCVRFNPVSREGAKAGRGAITQANWWLHMFDRNECGDELDLSHSSPIAVDRSPSLRVVADRRRGDAAVVRIISKENVQSKDKRQPRLRLTPHSPPPLIQRKASGGDVVSLSHCCRQQMGKRGIEGIRGRIGFYRIGAASMMA